jgi:hypothetical protein
VLENVVLRLSAQPCVLMQSCWPRRRMTTPRRSCTIRDDKGRGEG